MPIRERLDLRDRIHDKLRTDVLRIDIFIEFEDEFVEVDMFAEVHRIGVDQDGRKGIPRTAGRRDDIGAPHMSGSAGDKKRSKDKKQYCVLELHVANILNLLLLCLDLMECNRQIISFNKITPMAICLSATRIKIAILDLLPDPHDLLGNRRNILRANHDLHLPELLLPV